MRFLPLLLLGFVFALWGRSLQYDDQLSLGLKDTGQIRIRAAGGAISLSATEALLNLGAKTEFNWASKPKSVASASHSGARFHFQKLMEWEIRIAVWILALVGMVILFVLMKMLKPSSS